MLSAVRKFINNPVCVLGGFSLLCILSVANSKNNLMDFFKLIQSIDTFTLPINSDVSSDIRSYAHEIAKPATVFAWIAHLTNHTLSLILLFLIIVIVRSKNTRKSLIIPLLLLAIIPFSSKYLFNAYESAIENLLLLENSKENTDHFFYVELLNRQMILNDKIHFIQRFSLILFFCLTGFGIHLWSSNEKRTVFLKRYKVFQNSFGDYDAVKQGWSWPAFIFTYLWALMKALYSLGCNTFFCIIVISFFCIRILKVPQQIDPIISLAFHIVFGLYGNIWRERHLISRGFTELDTVIAPNPKGAIAKYMAATHE